MKNAGLFYSVSFPYLNVELLLEFNVELLLEFNVELLLEFKSNYEKQ